MKKILALLLVLVMLATALVGCGKKKDEEKEATDENGETDFTETDTEK